MRKFSIVGLQLELARDGNMALLAEQVAIAKRRFPWLDMIVASELSCHGVSTERAEPLPGPSEEAFIELARQHGVWLIPGTLFERDGDKVYNTAPVINPAGEIVARFRKIYPFYPYEEGVSGGTELCVFDVPGIGRFGLSICYDIWFPEVTRSLAWMGADVVINPSLTNTVDRDVELALVRGGAASNQLYVFNVNGGGKLGWGRSIVCGPGGEILYQAGTGQEVFALELDLDYVRRVRERGWNGLGQVVKSFRDHPMSFPPYERGARSATFDALGPLKKPEKTNE